MAHFFYFYTNPESERRMSLNKSQRGNCSCRWEDNIKMDLQKVGWGGMDCIDLVQDWDFIKCGEFLDQPRTS